MFRRQTGDRPILEQVQDVALEGPLAVAPRTDPGVQLPGQRQKPRQLGLAETAPGAARPVDRVLDQPPSGLEAQRRSLRSDPFLPNRTSSPIQNQVIGVAATRDHALAQAVGRIDHHLGGKGALRIDREQDSRQLRGQHPLNDQREASPLVEPPISPVGASALRLKGVAATLHRRDQGVGAVDAQHRLVDAGGGGFGQILDRRRAAHGQQAGLLGPGELAPEPAQLRFAGGLVGRKAVGLGNRKAGSEQPEQPASLSTEARDLLWRVRLKAQDHRRSTRRPAASIRGARRRPWSRLGRQTCSITPAPSRAGPSPW
jgi:hypothetical protein